VSFTCRQFHQCFTRTFFLQNFGAKKFQTKTQLWKFLLQNFVQKCAIKTLMKLTPGVNFINIFTRSFYKRSSPKRKNSVKLSVSFYTFGIYSCKSCKWNVDGIDSCSQFHQRFLHAFFVQIFGAKLKRNLAPKICKKNARKKRWWNWHLKENYFSAQSDNSRKPFCLLFLPS